MEKIRLTYSDNNAVATITLDDGKGNVLDNIMMNELIDTFISFKDNSDLKIIIIEGEGKHFSFGASVEEHTAELAEMMIRTFHKLFMTIIDLHVPILASVSGQCLGGGMELALICNFIFADKTAKFGQPEIVLGVFPPPASLLLPLKLGYARAEELLITGKSISATEAENIGLVNHLYEDQESLSAGIQKWVQENILPKSASSLRYAVMAGRVKFNHILGNFLPKLEFMYTQQLMKTNDAQEGINSFLEKRTPEWTNS